MKPPCLDVTRLVRRAFRRRLPTGVDRVGLAYCRHFHGRAHAVLRAGARTLVFSRAASDALLAALVEAPARPPWRALAQGLPRQAGSAPLHGAILLNTGHGGLDSPASAGQLRRLQARPLFMLHDLIPLTHPEYCRPGEDRRHAVRVETMLAVASALVANSDSTLAQLRRYAGARALPPAVAAPLGGAALPAPAPERPMAQPYFVVLSTIEPRKNHSMLLQVWRALVQRHGEAAPRLVVIGQRGWECENAVDLLERCRALRGVVSEIGRCGDAALATWLHHAQALLFPSFAEGYGLPLVEALGAGVPVIASGLAAFRESAGAVPDYLDPLDGLGWMAAAEAYAAPGSPARAAQLERLGAFRAPTWRSHFERVEQLMEELA